jgi:hypothetical protein
VLQFVLEIGDFLVATLVGIKLGSHEEKRLLRRCLAAVLAQDDT